MCCKPLIFKETPQGYKADKEGTCSYFPLCIPVGERVRKPLVRIKYDDLGRKTPGEYTT